jgi:saccharopine dehydrogenase-like NADP-dependent oxidoreductase
MSEQEYGEEKLYCLLVSRHNLLKIQERDIEEICYKIDYVRSLPTDSKELKELVTNYDAVIGNLPIPIYLNILNAGRQLFTFVVEMLDTFSSEEEKEKILEKYKHYKDYIIITEPDDYTHIGRVMIYEGLSRINSITVDKTEVIKH